MSDCVWLLRHGDTDWSQQDLHTGRRDVTLSEHGRDQARAAGRLLLADRFDRVLVSPQARALETCELAGLHASDSVPDLVEWDYGEFEGLTDEESEERHPGWDLFRDGAPGGESPDQIRERLDRVLGIVDALEGTIMLVGHGKLLRALAARWLGCEIATAKFLPMDPAAICVLDREPAGPLLRLWNLTSPMIEPVHREPFVPSFVSQLPRARAALAFASQLHRGQRRESDGAPFILHPLEVASLLHNTGHSEVVVTAGVLHESVEDAAASLEDLEQRFGGEVAGLVGAMTEDESIEDFARRKAALREQIADAGPDAASLEAADKVAKMRELRGRLAAQPDLLERQPRERARAEHYHETLAMLEEVTRDHPLVRQLRFELEALRALPPRTE